MDKVWIIARHEYLVHVRRLSFIIITALVPALGILGLLIGTVFGQQAPAFLDQQFNSMPDRIGIVDQLGDFTPILPSYQGRYTLFSDQEAGRAAVAREQIDSLWIIPQDYIELGQVRVISKGSSFSAAVLEDSTTVHRFFIDHLVRDGMTPEMRLRLADPIIPVSVSLSAEGEAEGSPLDTVMGIMVPYLFALLLIVTIFSSSGYLLRSVSEEKTNRVIELILSSVSAQELLAGKVLGLGAVGLTQVAVWMISIVALSGGAMSLFRVSVPLLSRPEVFILAVIYYLFGFLLYAVLMGSMGALGTTMQESQQLSGIISIFVAGPLVLAGIILANPNGDLARILSWIPFTAPTIMMLRVALVEVPVVDIVGSIVLLLIAIPAVLWAGSKVFRLGLLMYGKRPSVAQIIQAVRKS